MSGVCIACSEGGGRVVACHIRSKRSALEFVRRNAVHLSALGLTLGLGAWVWASLKERASREAPPSSPTPLQKVERVDSERPSYVGTDACTTCHLEQRSSFRGSDHDRAMEPPSPTSVAAPFDGRRFVQDGMSAEFRRDESGYWVRTHGADTELHDYRVAWTLGVEPLQQYLLDVGNGRLQAFTVAWDERPGSQGGQRLYSLHPGEVVEAGDPLHWTSPMHGWNSMCADCHSTAYEKGYDPNLERFEPRWVEPNVGCEACHGPGSSHVAWARDSARTGDSRLVVDLSNERTWTISNETHNAIAQPDDSHTEVDTCAPCHSRRHQIAEGRRPDQPWLDFYRPELLSAGLYQADGQIEDEVFVWGSFVQSKMFHAGVRCSDCHDPHSTELKVSGNALCGQCHDATVYQARSHHHHAPDSTGSKCVSCHMPARVYMGIDARRDHALRIPRPDLSAKLGTTNACIRCHTDRTNDWAVANSSNWWTDIDDGTHFGSVLAAGREGRSDALVGLVRLAKDDEQPAIVRATALSLMNAQGERARSALGSAIADPDPVVRLGAILGARSLSGPSRWAVLAPALDDPRAALRIEATRLLADVPPEAVRGAAREALHRTRAELLDAEALHGDRADAWLRIGTFEGERGRLDEAEQAFRRALELDPNNLPARIDLADLARARGDELGVERWLGEALALQPDHPEALHARGLARIRRDEREAALEDLRRAAEARPELPRFTYVFIVALREQGHHDEARAVLGRALQRHPDDPSLARLRRAGRSKGDAR